MKEIIKKNKHILLVIVILIFIGGGLFIYSNKNHDVSVADRISQPQDVNITLPTPQARDTIMSTAPVAKSNYIVGAYYMPKPAYPTHQFYDLVAYNRDPQKSADAKFRKPLLGFYSGTDVGAMEKQIGWASSNGINYFIFDDYWTYSQSTPVYAESFKSFESARNKTYINYAGMITDLAAANRTRAEIKQKFLGDIFNYYKTKFESNNYLRIDGKPVLYILNNGSLGEGTQDPTWIKELLTEFDSQLGEQVYWIYAGTSSSEKSFQYLKDMGYLAIHPYLIAPGVNESVNTKKSMTYKNFTDKALQIHQTYFNKTKSVGIGYIPSVSSNFDERSRVYSDNWIVPRSYTTAQNISIYATYLRGVKAKLDAKTNTSKVVSNKKVLIGVGAFNEWIEDTQIEPGLSNLNTQNPFQILRTITKELKITFESSANLDIYVHKDITPTIANISLWNWADSDQLKYWHVYPNATTPEVVNGLYGNLKLESGESLVLEAPVNVNTSEFSGISLTYSSVCAGGVNCDATKSIQAVWYTNCSTNNTKSCIGSQFINPKDIAKCSNKANDSDWGECIWTIDPKDKSWNGKLEKLRFVIYVEPMHPIDYSIGTIKLVQK